MDVSARLGGHVAAIDELARQPENWIDSHGTRFARHLVRHWRPAGWNETAEGIVYLAAFVAPPGTSETFRVMTEGAYDVLRLTDVLPDPGVAGGGLALDHRGRAEEALDLKERKEGQEAARLTHLVQVIAPEGAAPQQDAAFAADPAMARAPLVWRLLAFVVRSPAQGRALSVETLSHWRGRRPALSDDGSPSATEETDVGGAGP